jgi:uncharacterized membrane protein YidH (DUF202 family)
VKQFSSLLRIICGVILIILGYSTYSRNSAHINAGEPMQVFGHVTNAEPWQLTLAFGLIGLIGLFLIVLGCVNLLKSR